MDNKSQRLAEIKKIIQNEQVNSQDELLKNLLSTGFHVTQATLSRDLKLLKIAKMPDNNGSYLYVLPNSQNFATKRSNTDSHSLDGLLSIEFNENVGVIKTLPAYSPAIASTIDNCGLLPIAGTLAGEDTIIFVVRRGYNENDVKNALLKEFPDLIDKLL